MDVSAESRRRSNQQAGWGGDDLAGQDQLWERVRFLAGIEWAAERGRESGQGSCIRPGAVRKGFSHACSPLRLNHPRTNMGKRGERKEGGAAARHEPASFSHICVFYKTRK